MKANSFEQSPTKETIRAAIARQMLAVAKQSKTGEFSVVSLPGKNWRFESRLQVLCDVNDVALQLRAFEKDPDIYKAENPFFPACAGNEREGEISIPMTQAGNVSDEDWNEHSVTYLKGFFNYGNAEAVWADYCGYAKEKELNAFSDWLNGNGKIGFATFDISVRIPDCLPAEILAGWNKPNVLYIERAALIRDYIAKRTKSKLVFLRIYQNKGHNKSIMLTIGFAKKPSRIETVIQNDFEGQGPNRQTYAPKVTKELGELVLALAAIHPPAKVAEIAQVDVSRLAGIKAAYKRHYSKSKSK